MPISTYFKGFLRDRLLIRGFFLGQSRCADIRSSDRTLRAPVSEASLATSARLSVLVHGFDHFLAPFLRLFRVWISPVGH